MSEPELHIDEVRRYAEAHVWDPVSTPDFVPGEDPHHVVVIKDPEGDIQLIFTVTRWEGQVLRQLSIAPTAEGVLPHPLFIHALAERFGFLGSMDDWQTSLNGHGGLTILQPLAPHP